MDPTTAKMMQMHLRVVQELCEGVDELVIAAMSKGQRRNTGESREFSVNTGDRVKITTKGGHNGRVGEITGR